MKIKLSPYFNEFTTPSRRDQLKYLFLELTQKCNMACEHCGSNCSSNTRCFELTTEQWKQFILSVSKQFDSDRLVFCITGGDPFKLLHTLNCLDMLHEIKECVREKRSIYIGISAGAYLASQSIRYVMQLEDNNIIDDGLFGSLGFVSECLICHYEHYSYTTLKACEEKSGNKAMTINDDQLLIWEDGKWSYIE